jgi:hypothetical protein
VAAYLRFQGDLTIEVAEDRPEELAQRDEAGLPTKITTDEVDLDHANKPGTNAGSDG